MYIEPEERLVTSDIAKICGVSSNTVRRWAREGRLPAHMKISKRIRYWRRGDIYSFIGAYEATR